MGHHQRCYNLKKSGENVEKNEEKTLLLVWTNPGYHRRKSSKLVYLISISIFVAYFFFYSSITLHPLDSFVERDGGFSFPSKDSKAPLSSSSIPHDSFVLRGGFSSSNPHDSFIVKDEGSSFPIKDSKAPLTSSNNPHGTIKCDRSHFRTNVCNMKGDIRTHSVSSSIFLYTSNHANESLDHEGEEENGYKQVIQHEKIKPYTRKWEASIMDTIGELSLISKNGNPGTNHHCDVKHEVPAVVFSTGGYTGNVYHEFNDGIVPLFITSQHFNKKVVFVILEYHNWWMLKYKDILAQLSDYPLIDFSGDRRTHCFPEAIVGLRIHDELTVDSSLMSGKKSIFDFRNLIDQAFTPRVRFLEAQEKGRRLQERGKRRRPKLVILSRDGSRSITNENSIIQIAKKIGFRVQVLQPRSKTELAKMYMALNSSDVMIGVHGAALTHFMFMRPGSVFIQVVPLGTDWAAETYYGDPAKKLDLNYIGYKILHRESSLSFKYDKDDPIIKNPRSVTKKGWQYTKEIYLEGQNVRLDMKRFQKHLVEAYVYSKKMQHVLH